MQWTQGWWKQVLSSLPCLPQQVQTGGLVSLSTVHSLPPTGPLRSLAHDGGPSLAAVLLNSGEGSLSPSSTGDPRCALDDVAGKPAGPQLSTSTPWPRDPLVLAALGQLRPILPVTVEGPAWLWFLLSPESAPWL